MTRAGLNQFRLTLYLKTRGLPIHFRVLNHVFSGIQNLLCIYAFLFSFHLINSSNLELHPSFHLPKFPIGRNWALFEHSYIVFRGVWGVDLAGRKVLAGEEILF